MFDFSTLTAQESNRDQAAQQLSDEGLRLYKEKRYEAALEVFTVGIEKAKTFAPLYYNRGLALSKLAWII